MRAICTVACLSLLLFGACDEGDGDGGRRPGTRMDCAAPVDARTPVERRFTVAGRSSPALAVQTATALCARVRDLGVAEVQVEPSGAMEIEVRAPPGSERDLMQAAQPGRLRFYDFEPNVLGGRGPDDPFRGSTALYEAVVAASKARPRAESTDVPPTSPELDAVKADRRNDSAGKRYYLFDQDRQPLGDPQPSRAALAPGGATPEGARVLSVPRGIVVLEAERAPDQPEDIRAYYVLEDDAELAGSDIENPEADEDEQTREPVLTLEFTDRGRAAFAAVTRRIAERSAESTALLPPGTTEELRQSQLARFAITLDNAVVSIATIDNEVNPEGIDGRTGAQINGIGTLDETRRLATLLESEPLPAELVPLP